VSERTAWTVTTVLAVLTVFALALSVPASLREAYERGGFYVFTRQFLDDIPRRLGGPGRFRFLLQPAVAIALGIIAGRSDARAGRPSYLHAVFFGHEDRTALVRGAFRSIANLLLMGILVDSVCQWLILGTSYPGAALVVGPILIVAPYSLSRALAYHASAAGR
jgi:hypothetical protein